MEATASRELLSFAGASMSGLTWINAPPKKPIEGQIYWDAEEAVARVFSGRNWLPMAASPTSLQGYGITDAAPTISKERCRHCGTLRIVGKIRCCSCAAPY